jgi:hypothetical protein
MLTAKQLASSGVDPQKAKALEGIFSGLNFQQILAIIQAILAALANAVPTTPPSPAP